MFFRYRMTSFLVEPTGDEEKGWFSRRMDCVITYLEENRQNIFYLFIFYVITVALFVERFIRKFTKLRFCKFSNYVKVLDHNMVFSPYKVVPRNFQDGEYI